jgi:hypothetical protein
MKINWLRNKLLLSVLSGFLVLSLSGCFALVVGGMAETALVLADRRPISVVTIDRGLQLEIESTLTNRFSETAHLSVNVFNQKVLLTGEASTQSIKDQIQSTAAKVKNIRTLVNEMQVAPPSSVGSRLSDSSLFTLVKAKLLATSDVPLNSMKIVVEAGSVYLMGITTELESKAAATVTSKSSDSIKQVVKLFDIITEEEKQKLNKPSGNEKSQSSK